ncbi:hypothetical protein GUITHDRAFT_110347 [Guillardia theta CCMP2712]|uniref:Uncharacterized protein n=1 Tax=Guillardia theta (strain CCMP2712) TaxID=905079 RepID=L1J4V5_GUITC|nr:hypothetical protein GUITHDRAFT_110347 [Guillardia theta CCMP2712]EKX43541.1 hypothetical protein GUITHDRAFT_110347 [Guillardia theta CCMP2712]|eukprot:XP_005830521.1 hypothetical protein GUITHDRAFT_110347 [Guillardia theta CCMP2712]
MVGRASITIPVAQEIFRFSQTNKAEAGPLDKWAPTQSSNALAAQYGITAKAVRDIWNKRTWVHATHTLWTEEEKNEHKVGENAKILRLKMLKKKMQTMAMRLSAAQSSVHRTIKAAKWKGDRNLDRAVHLGAFPKGLEGIIALVLVQLQARRCHGKEQLHGNVLGNQGKNNLSLQRSRRNRVRGKRL